MNQMHRKLTENAQSISANAYMIPLVISLCNQNTQNCWLLHSHFMTERLQKFQLFSNPVTLDEGQGHPDWYQNVVFGYVYHHTQFERTPFMSIQMQTDVEVLSHRVKQEIHLARASANQHGSTLNCINTNCKICKNMSEYVSAFSYKCNLN